MFDEIKENLDLAHNSAVDLNDKLSKGRPTNNHRSCSIKKGVLKNFAKFTEKIGTPQKRDAGTHVFL